MLAEVNDGSVDASIGGFSTSLERFELVEFSQSLVTAIIALTMKTPDKSDQVSYSSRKISRILKSFFKSTFFNSFSSFSPFYMDHNFCGHFDFDDSTFRYILFVRIIQN